jgi:hypothetical protein
MGDPRPGRWAIALVSVMLAAGSTSGSSMRSLSGGARSVECGPTWNRVPTEDPGEGDNVLEAIDAAGDDDIWVVGRHAPYPYRTLTEHWDGSAWTVVPSPNLGNDSNFLEDVSARAADDAWSVGYFIDPDVPRALSLILHWDGAQWDRIPAPHVGKNSNILHGVAAIAPDDVWAVGEMFTSKGLVLHWDGARWDVVPTPGFGQVTTFVGVEALASDDVWVIGASTNAFFLHWDGATWTTVPAVAGQPVPFAMGLISPDDAWAVGVSSDFKTTTQHWDGSAWTAVPSPNVGSFTNALTGVAGVATDDVWAVGSFYDFSRILTRTMVQHWDGRRWSVVDTPDIDASTNTLQAVTVTPDRHVWAAGFGPGQGESLVERVCPAVVSGSGFSPQVVPVERGLGVAWLFDPANVGEHSVTDASGLGLFDSGTRGPGEGFTFSYFSAGTYGVTDTIALHTGSVQVALHARPRQGPETGTFRIVWADRRLPGVYVADIQVKRPGSEEFVDWLIGQTVFAANFVPDAGSGTYEFRARVRDPISGAASEYSPVASLEVEEG